MKLSEITRRENCFFTRDGQVLKTIQDLLDFLLNCDAQSYAYHVTGEKNDFAGWVSEVLLFPELGKSIKNAKNVSEARDEIMEFFQIFDYRSKWIPEEKTFHTMEGCELKNIQELYYYLNNCDENSFRYHANDQKNDFANWVSDVLLFPSLSAKMRVEPSRRGMITVLKEFLTTNTAYGTNEEYSRYVDERRVKDETNTKDKGVLSTNNNQITNNNPSTNNTIVADAGSAAVNIYEKSNSSEKIVEEKIDLDHKLNLGREEEEEKEDKGPAVDTGSFRQFTDEELEKFVSFSREEKNLETDARLEYLKVALQELKNMVRELRRAEKDPLIADLMLRNVNAKIDYYAQSKTIGDYNQVIRLMKDAQHEIEDCVTQPSYNIAEEIMKDLRLQGLAMKKA